MTGYSHAHHGVLNAALQQRQWAFLRGDGVTEMTGFRSANVETSNNDLSYAT